MRLTELQRSALCLSLMVLLAEPAFGADSEVAGHYGVDYAFLFLMTLSPDFAAANYTIHNGDGTNVDTSIGRLPYNVELARSSDSRLQLQVSLAAQRTHETVLILSGSGDHIDSRWDTYGANLGLLYEYAISNQLRFTPTAHFGLARMENHASYHGMLAELVRSQWDGTVFNWATDASVSSIGIGARYDWRVRGRSSSVRLDAHHVLVDSFDESNMAVSFTEHADMMAARADMIFPTDLSVHGEQLDLVALLGANGFFGANRDTLGYTTSYQAGLGAEFPIAARQGRISHLRLSGEVVWAENMRGWLLSVGYNPD